MQDVEKKSRLINAIQPQWLKKLKIIVLCSVLVVPSSVIAEPDEIYDPLEDVNRGIFWFNNKLDVNILEPVARGYKSVMPDFARTGVSNFFSNLRYPSYLVSDVVQGKFGQALDHTGRFLINSTIGVGGLIDFATDMGLPDHQEDFGIGLAYHGVPAGPYLMLPFLGPSNLRDGVGTVVDGFLDPIGWVGYSSLSGSTKLIIAASALGLRTIHTRAGLIQAIETARESSVDYYGFVQGAYYQHRAGILNDGMDTDDDDVFDDSGSTRPASKSAETLSMSSEQQKDVELDRAQPRIEPLLNHKIESAKIP